MGKTQSKSESASKTYHEDSMIKIDIKKPNFHQIVHREENAKGLFKNALFMEYINSMGDNNYLIVSLTKEICILEENLIQNSKDITPMAFLESNEDLQIKIKRLLDNVHDNGVRDVIEKYNNDINTQTKSNLVSIDDYLNNLFN
eukprot:TRINITY_DN14093_c0_g1_i1.p1 TRINITY_DN14093_c0_g1~~TRINITY_DN14093_c0_g1_i1.p1  ORF type:complete len:144 (-),score=25.09 TRINITY_DN14093_c0_g1_i1:80-511(-)